MEHVCEDSVTSASCRGRSRAGAESSLSNEHSLGLCTSPGWRTHLAEVWVSPFLLCRENTAGGLGKESQGQNVESLHLPPRCLPVCCQLGWYQTQKSPVNQFNASNSGRVGLFKAVSEHSHGPELDLFHMLWETQLVGATVLHWIQLCVTHPLVEMKIFLLSYSFPPKLQGF